MQPQKAVNRSVFKRSNNATLGLSPQAREQQARRLGLGATCDDAYVQATLRDVMGCSGIVAMPNLEFTTWDVGGAITDDEIERTFSCDGINLLSSGKQVPGVDRVQTTFITPGILQTGIIVTGIGFHVHAEPLCFTAEGNSWSQGGGLAPQSLLTAPGSPDVFTAVDAAGSASTSFANLTPATLSWGWPMQYAAWLLVNAYSFNWTVRQRYNILSESARYIAYFSSFADAEASGDSQVDVVGFARQVNDRYREKGTGAVFLPVNRRRQGSFLQAATEGSVWRPTRDFDLVDVQWGGLGLQNRQCNNPFFKLPSPYYIPPNSPIGLSLEETNCDKGDLFRKMLSITDGQGGNVPPVVSPDVNANVGFDAGMAELSLDASAAAALQSIEVGRARFKGGELLISMIIKGYEVTDEFAAICLTPSLKAALCAEFGMQFCC